MSYSELRKQNIARNNAKLTELGLDTIREEIALSQKKKKKPRSIKKRKRTASIPTRSSRRTKNQPPPIYTPDNAQEERELANQKQDEQISKGYRKKNGTWRGQKFGAVKNVPVGTVFGAGDYQRAGRFEMAMNGFFLPVVTCEWIDSTTKEVFAIVVNNDNGLSRDKGDVLVYAGAGGRRRGQNRTATQSYHQTWTSATNAALRNNFKSKRPVRVIRGPKCEKEGTKESGGGYRYDGLYLVKKAVMEVGKSGLETAMFTLVKK